MDKIICLPRRIMLTLRAMKRTLLAAFIAAVMYCGAVRTAQATEVGYGRKFGLGFVLGDPTGLSAKWWVGATNSLDFGLGVWGYGLNDRCYNNGNGGVYCNNYGGNGTFNMDYLWQSNIIRGQAQLDWHIGAGGRAIWFRGCNGNCFDVGARMPVGLDLMFNGAPFLELFLEIAPSFYVVHGVGFDVEGGFGARFYF
jgi:hypothetical protein